MGLILVEAPAVEPVTLEEAKLHMKVDTTEDDALISVLIAAARKVAEEYTRRAFITQTWEYSIDSLELYTRLPRPPVQLIESVTVDGEAISPENYELIQPDMLLAKVPMRAIKPRGVVVRYKAGYGSNSSDVPQPIRQAILMLAAHMYENREGQAPEAKYEAQAESRLPSTVAALLQPYRVMML